MRDAGDFISDLRAEIEAGKAKRADYVKQKMFFAIGLLSVGNFETNRAEDGSLIVLLYLVPLVVIAFDLFIIGEDFGVKRAGKFIATSQGAPEEEKSWECEIPDNRSSAPAFANITASSLAIIAATVGIGINDPGKWFGLWMVASFSSLSLVYFYGKSIVCSRISSNTKIMTDHNKSVTKDERLARLFEYTKWHLGIYLAIGAAAASSERIFELAESHAFHIMFWSMVVAGACGAVIATNVITCRTYEELEGVEKEKPRKIGPWNLALLPYRAWATIEHLAFWFGLLLPGVILLYADSEKPDAPIVPDKGTPQVQLQRDRGENQIQDADTAAALP